MSPISIQTIGSFDIPHAEGARGNLQGAPANKKWYALFPTNPRERVRGNRRCPRLLYHLRAQPTIRPTPHPQIPFQKGLTHITNTNTETDRELLKEFADCLVALGDPKEAAVRVGISPERALTEGLRMADSKEVRRYVSKKKKRESAAALSGLRRLAFGRINDALALLADDPSGINYQRLDLFNVAEIKRPKGGGVEIKFFDRLEALGKLSELENSAADAETADSLFEALRKTAANSEEPESVEP